MREVPSCYTSSIIKSKNPTLFIKPFEVVDAFQEILFEKFTQPLSNAQRSVKCSRASVNLPTTAAVPQTFPAPPLISETTSLISFRLFRSTSTKFVILVATPIVIVKRRRTWLSGIARLKGHGYRLRCRKPEQCARGHRINGTKYNIAKSRAQGMIYLHSYC